MSTIRIPESLGEVSSRLSAIDNDLASARQEVVDLLEERPELREQFGHLLEETS